MFLLVVLCPCHNNGQGHNSVTPVRQCVCVLEILVSVITLSFINGF